MTGKTLCTILSFPYVPEHVYTHTPIQGTRIYTCAHTDMYTYMHYTHTTTKFLNKIKVYELDMIFQAFNTAETGERKKKPEARLGYTRSCLKKTKIK